MKNLRKRIIAEVKNLRILKRTVFCSNFNSCDIEASNICLSADVLLIPLYWFWNIKYPGDQGIVIEDYLTESVDAFKAKSPEMIHILLLRTEEVDEKFQTRPFESYRKLLSECFPEIK